MMARPKVNGRMTTTLVARKLDMGRGQLIRWVNQGALPPATSVDDNGVRYFDQDWLDKAKEIMARRRV